jgi:threonine dehydratase
MTLGLDDIRDAHRRIHPYIHCTPVVTSSALNRMFGCELFFKAENLQKIGAFKARGACNAIFSLDQSSLERGVITHSSGNHGAALAWSAALRGISCTVVMPENAPATKKVAVAGYGAKIEFCEPTMAGREETVVRLIEEQGSTLVHPFDSDVIIAGQGTAALEMLQQIDEPVDIMMTPVGGGGLLGGTAISAKQLNRDIRVLGAEPEAASDAWQGFKSGTRLTQVAPNTIADGLRGIVGVRNFVILREQVDDILLTSEARIVEAMRLIWTRLKMVVEPSAAVPLAAIMDQPEQFLGKRVAIILSGGNLDLDALPW